MSFSYIKLFEYYYSQSHNFKGNWPDTLEAFTARCDEDAIFCSYWYKRFEIHKEEQERLKFKAKNNPAV